MQMDFPITDNLVLIGGGHAHALVLLNWAMNPVPGVALTVINPAPTAPYTGMLPGHIAGHYSRDALEIDLVKLTRHAGARLVLGRAAGIDRDRSHVEVEGRAPVHFDLASLDIGITSDLPDVPGFLDFGHAAKPLGPYAGAWERFLASRPKSDAGNVIVIGGGVGGVELALAMAHRIRTEGFGGQVTVIEQMPEILTGLGRAATRALKSHMVRLGVKVMCKAKVGRITPEAVHLADGQILPAGFVTGAAGARPQGWLADTGLALTEGFVRVTPSLQTETDPRIFAVGDCAHMAFAPRPKAGVFAVRQAPVLAANLRAALQDAPMKAFRPQSDYLKLISTGGRGAVADKWGLRLDGAALWRLKDRIDQKFMRKFHDLPEMPAPAIPKGATTRLRAELMDAPPLCGGCGAKMGRDALKATLAALPPDGHGDLISGPGDDAAILKHGDRQQVFTTDHLRAFVSDPYLMTEIAAAHALGDIWAMGATPQAALVQVILPRLSDRLQREMLAEIMSAASAVFGKAGAAVAGGHTSIGAELTIGFALTGLSGDRVIGLDGAGVGDALILTKPLGSGTILAAEMRKLANGRDVSAAYEWMRQGQGAASAILAPVGHAMTDVTGFGLAGHLMGLCEASGVSATLELARLPLMDGALDLSRRGIRSSLWATNRASVAGIEPSDDPRADLLYDPQTSGGLLAAVPEEAAQAVLQDLAKSGVPARRIGWLNEGPPAIRFAPDLD